MGTLGAQRQLDDSLAVLMADWRRARTAQQQPEGRRPASAAPGPAAASGGPGPATRAERREVDDFLCAAAAKATAAFPERKREVSVEFLRRGARLRLAWGWPPSSGTAAKAMLRRRLRDELVGACSLFGLAFVVLEIKWNWLQGKGVPGAAKPHFTHFSLRDAALGDTKTELYVFTPEPCRRCSERKRTAPALIARACQKRLRGPAAQFFGICAVEALLAYAKWLAFREEGAAAVPAEPARAAAAAAVRVWGVGVGALVCREAKSFHHQLTRKIRAEDEGVFVWDGSRLREKAAGAGASRIGVRCVNCAMMKPIDFRHRGK